LAFGRHNDVLAHPIYNASYAVSVRQYRSLPFGFLHSQGHPWRACHLLTVRSVTSARDGTFTLWIKMQHSPWFIEDNLYF